MAIAQPACPAPRATRLERLALSLAVRIEEAVALRMERRTARLQRMRHAQATRWKQLRDAEIAHENAIMQAQSRLLHR